MTVQKFNELKKRYFIYDDVEAILDFVSELQYMVARETESKEPYAVNTIKKLDDAAHEVWGLIEYVNELEEE